MDYTQAWCRACRATAKVLAAAKQRTFAEIDPAALSPEAAARLAGPARAALDAWDRYWAFVRRHMGRYVFGEFWVHYWPGPFGQTWPDTRKLRELAGPDYRPADADQRPPM